LKEPILQGKANYALLLSLKRLKGVPEKGDEAKKRVALEIDNTTVEKADYFDEAQNLSHYLKMAKKLPELHSKGNAQPTMGDHWIDHLLQLHELT